MDDGCSHRCNGANAACPSPRARDGEKVEKEEVEEEGESRGSGRTKGCMCVSHSASSPSIFTDIHLYFPSKEEMYSSSNT